MNKIIVVGGGGLGNHIKNNLDGFSKSNYKFEGFLDKNKKLKTKYNDQNIKKISKKNFFFINGIGNFAFNWYPKLFLNYRKEGFKFLKLIHESAIISNKTSIGEGTLIMENALIKSNSKIGKFCLINSSAIISHDVSVGNFCNISLGAKVGGNVKIGNNSFLGMNSTVIQGITIGSNSIIGAGAVVTKNIGDNVVAIGNPVFEYRENNK